ncbi:MAG: DUF1553 domain-containing protein [Bryobacteraceae bacterium]
MKTELLILTLSAPLWAAKVSVYPPKVELFGRGATQVLAASLDDEDLTAGCSLASANPKVVSAAGSVLTAVADGKTSVTVNCKGQQQAVPVTVSAAGEAPRLSFVKDVVPIFTMGGCAGSNCHGSIRGQRGFKLSLFGYEPEVDYEAIKKRIDLRDPEKSLILEKAVFQQPHGGGFRFAVGSLEYRTILNWIRDGATYDSEGSPRIASLDVYPEERLLVGVGATQQLVATARYTDGTVRDVTHLVQYSSNNADVVQISPDGTVKALQPGETAIMVRTLGKAVASRIAVIERRASKDYPRVPRNNYIDEFVFSKLHRMNIVPSGLSTDSQFLRRVYLDTIGLLPTETEAREFLESKDPSKRAHVIDRLLERPEFAEMWALKFAELFRAGTREAGAKGGRIVYEYMKRSFFENKPWDKITTELLLSQGAHMFGRAPASFYNISFDSNAPDHATNISQVFLGLRIECAKCHNHPWEKWTQDDFYGFAAFFARVAIKEAYENDENTHYYKEEGTVEHPRTKKPVTPKYLDGPEEQDAPEKDIRFDLARWMTDPKNPFFARAIVNRMWKHYMGRGLVEEVDDFRVTNPPTHPALLDAMANDLAQNGYDLRHLIRAILNSRAYQLTAEPNESNRGDEINYSRYIMRRLMAEQMLDTISQVTGVAEKYRGYPPETRAMQVYSGAPHYMLSAFGRLSRDIICERDHQPDIVQTLHLISGDTIQKKIVAKNSTIEAWLKESPDETIIDRIFLTTLTRYPEDAERARIAASLGDNPEAAKRRGVYQDVMWAILNSREFLYNH